MRKRLEATIASAAVAARVEEVAEKILSNTVVSAAAVAHCENKLLIAGVNRWATQNQMRQRVFPQPLELVPLPGRAGIESFSANCFAADNGGCVTLLATGFQGNLRS